MTKKQKLVLAMTAIVMFVIIAGLSIAVVLVASQAQATSSMKVTFTSKEVMADITCSAHIVTMADENDNIGTVVDEETHPQLLVNENGENVLKDTFTLTFDAGQETQTQNIQYSTVEYSNFNYRIRYEFTILNKSTRKMQVEVSKTGADTPLDNMLTTLYNATTGEQESSSALPTFIIEEKDDTSDSDQATIYFFVYVEDNTKDGTFDGNTLGALSITLTGLADEQ